METPENLLLQLEYSNKHLKERYSSLQREVENVEGDNGALLKDISNLRRETKRRMEAESKRRILLEEMAEVRENLASENLVALNLKESVKELENQNEELKLEASHLSEENSALSTSHSNREQRLRKMRSSLRKLEIELQNYRLSSIEQNEELRKLKYQIEDMKEIRREKQLTIEVFTRKELNLADHLKKTKQETMWYGKVVSNTDFDCNLHSELTHALMEEQLLTYTDIEKTAGSPSHRFEKRLIPGDESHHVLENKSISQLLCVCHWIMWLLYLFLGTLLIFMPVMLACHSDHMVTEAYHRSNILEQIFWTYSWYSEDMSQEY